MADNIFGAMFGSFGGLINLLKYGLWFVAFLVLAAGGTGLAILIAMKKTQTKIVEIDMQNKRVRMFNGRFKKTKKGGIRQFWAAKIKRTLPKFQQRDIFTKGKQDIIFLIKDNNGLYHTARLPTWKQLKKWYDVQYDKDIEKGDDTEKLRHIYLLPTPHEDLDWLANQCVEADKEFKIDHWWQSPTIAYIGCGLVCVMILLLGIMSKRFGW